MLVVLFFFLAVTFLIFPATNVWASPSWSKPPDPNPYLNNDKNRILFNISKSNGDEFLVVLYVDGKPADEIHCVKGTSHCITPDNKGGALSLPGSISNSIVTIKVCEGSGGDHNADKWNCDGKPILLEATVDVSSSPKVNGPGGQNPCTTGPTGQCQTAIGNISTNPQAFATKILEIATGIAGGIALILMVIGSIKVLTSSGDQQKLAGGRDMIVGAVAGLLFLIFSVLILRFIGVDILGLR